MAKKYSDKTWWPAFIKAWDSIARDFSWDWIFWCAIGESQQNCDHGPVSPEVKKLCRITLITACPELDFIGLFQRVDNVTT